MINDKIVEKLVERLVNRVENGNTYVLKHIGESVKKIGTLSPSKAHQLVQILKYGGDYDKIAKELAKITKLNVQDIYKIFEEIAKIDYKFAKQFYDYKNIKYIPWEENTALQNQVKALAKVTANEYINITNTLAFATKKNGKIIYTELSKMYNKLLDEAVLNVSQGKETFDTEMFRLIKQLADSGIRKVDYESGRSIRVDSAVRMQMNGAIRNLHNEIQEFVGQEFGADGVEISVHEAPAPDHAEVQGKQFSKKEFDNFQNDRKATSYDGQVFLPEFEGHDRRSISQYNCYHYTFAIVLGVSSSNYSQEELNEINKKNEQGFEFEGKHYTNYEGTQLQRQIETEIRKQKDIQISARASGQDELAGEAQYKINVLTQKYKELSEASGLLTKKDRMRVNNFHNIKTKPLNYKEIEYARKNNAIWHSTENLKEILNDDKIIKPSISVGKEINKNVKYGTQFIEFKPEILENVNKATSLYLGDGGNQYSRKGKEVNKLFDILKDKPKYYNEIKFNDDLKVLKYIKKIYIRQDESKKIIDLLNKNKIDYEFYNDYRTRLKK